MSCQLLVCPPLPHAICSKRAATLTGLSCVVPCKWTQAKFTGPSEVLIITQSHLSCILLPPLCDVVRNKVRGQTEPCSDSLSECQPLAGECRIRDQHLSTCIARIHEN